MAAGGAVMGILGQVGQVASLIGANIDAGKTRKHLKKIGAQDPAYTTSPYAQQELGLANTLYNARMPGASAMERNIYQNQANTIGAINRNATDSSQALALAAGAQGQTNQAFNQLGIQEAQDQQRRYQNLVGAQRGMTAEHQSMFDDSIRRWQNKLGIEMKRNEIRQQQWGNLNNYSQQLGSQGSLGGMMGGGGAAGGSGGGF